MNNGNPLFSGGMPPMAPNHPLMQLMRAMQSGGNPEALVNQMLQQNPQIAQQIQALKTQSGGKSYQEIAAQLAKQRGLDINQIEGMLHNIMPKQR